MDYKLERLQMTCGSAEAESRVYIPIITDDGELYLIANQPNMADNIYSCSFDPRSQGFAGRTLHFDLVYGGSIDLLGPWHTNSESLLLRTGIDITDSHLTFVVIAENRTHGEWDTIYTNVLYKDEHPTIGKFDRGKSIAEEIANKLNKPVFCYRKSTGGSSDSPVYPTSWTEEQRRKYDWKKA